MVAWVLKQPWIAYLLAQVVEQRKTSPRGHTIDEEQHPEVDGLEALPWCHLDGVDGPVLALLPTVSAAVVASEQRLLRVPPLTDAGHGALSCHVTHQRDTPKIGTHVVLKPEILPRTKVSADNTTADRMMETPHATSAAAPRFQTRHSLAECLCLGQQSSSRTVEHRQCSISFASTNSTPEPHALRLNHRPRKIAKAIPLEKGENLSCCIKA